LTEELLFRGLLLDWLKQKMNVWMAAAILSVIFSLLHANPFSLGAVGWFAFSARFLQRVNRIRVRDQVSLAPPRICAACNLERHRLHCQCVERCIKWKNLNILPSSRSPFRAAF